ncbi:MAG: type III-A CRISPR-associated protein Cas10/Csm1, partial [Chloroflexi bacterium]|nr:type III-A CRISPR-associated protein Cas10/Csm1 [Chloroflexota bacterium]
VGKFWQRSSTKPRGPGFESFGPETFGKHGAHATWSAAFVEQYAPAIAHDVGYAVLYHHNPQDVLSKVVALADRLASGERADETDKQPRNLLSIFCQIGQDDGQRPQAAYLPLQPLTLEEGTLFPSSKYQDDSAAYNALWGAFADDAEALRDLEDAPAYLESLFHLLYRYAWCVPSAFYRSTPDISLYDHSRVTAAVAACLADQDERTLDLLLGGKQKDDTIPLAYLLEGDISGVQRFIYTITSKGAAKGLRGRSFYLQLLTEAIARFILREMDLPITNLIYAGGGHFYLLAPPDEIGRISAIQRTLDQLMLTHHDGALYVALGCAELRAADFQADAFSTKWREVSRDVASAKRRRFADDPAVFEPRGHGGNEKHECQVCHVERPDVTRRNPERDDEEPVRKCDLCVSLEELGRSLGHADYLILSAIPPQPDTRRGDWRDVLAALGTDVALLDERGKWSLEPAADADHTTVLGLRTYPSFDLARDLTHRLGCPVATGIRYTANVTPHRGRDVATFEDMQEASQGLKRLGVLRMDVDNLGYLFGQGFRRANGKSLSTLARVASLSSMMALFFEGWVGRLCQQINDEAGTGLVYTIYSGGDDLFIVGAWDVLPGLAATIQTDLSRFAADNPLIHASAGITLHRGKYPLYQAAQDAEAALDAAKDLPDKNAFTFMGQTLPWARYGDVDDRVQQLLAMEQSPGVGRSLFQVLGQLFIRHKNARDHATRTGLPQTKYGPWVWHGAYLLTRLAHRAKGPVGDDILSLRNRLLSDMEIIGLAARWAEALTRKQIEKEGV